MSHDAAAQAPTTNVGRTSTTQTATVTITASGTLSSISALTQGATGLDFKIVQPNFAGTPCTVGTAYAAGDTCTVQYTFGPLYPGVRAGGIRLTSSSSGATLSTVYLSGTGIGPFATFAPGVGSTIDTYSPSGFVPEGVAVDGSGAIYFSSYASDARSPATYRVIEKIPVGCTSGSCFQTVTSSVTGPTLLALDGPGNLYVYDNPNIKRIPPGCTSSGCMSIVGGGFQFVTGLAVDSAGNVFVSDQAARAVYEVPPGCASSTCRVSLGGGSWQYPTGVAVDGGGNVYVADGNTPQGAPENDQGQLHVMPPNCTNAGCVTNLSNAFGSLGNIAVDAVGNLYALDTSIGGQSNNGGIYELPASCRSCMVLLGSGYYFPTQSVVSASGTVYVADSNNRRLAEINLASPPALTFASTVAGQTSPVQSVTVANNGNAPLIFAIPGTGNNPSVSTNFSISNSSTCPMLNSSSADTASLAAGSNCSQILSFAPTMPGTINGSSTVTDNNLNASGATQSIALSGTGTKGTPTVSVVSPSVSVNTTAVTLEADISTAGAASTGAVTFSVNGGSAVAATCTGSTSPTACTATYNPSSLTAGSYSLVATIAADSNYNSASGSGTLTVTQGTPTLSLSSSGSTSKVNESVTFTASVSPASGITPSGKVSFTTTLNGTTSAIAGCTSVPLVGGAGPSLKATCTTSTLQAGSNSVAASLAGDSNFNAASSSTVTHTVNTVAPTVALSSSNSSSIVNGAVTFTATVTPSSGITPTGAVSFTTTLNGSTSPIAGCTSVALAGGAAACTTSALQAGSNTVKASIASDANFQAGSKSIGQTVSKATPSVTVSPTSSSSVNSPVTFVASVSPTSGILPTGTVSFSTTLNGTTSAIAGCTAVPLVSATTLTASCTTSALAAGSNTIAATLASDGNFNAASSAPVSQTVSKGAPSLSLSTANGSSTVNNPVTFVAVATPSSGITPTGNVSFSTTLNGTTSAIAGCTSVPLSGLSASCTTNALAVGSNSIAASIASDSNFNAATSNNVTETVNPGPLAKFLVPSASVVAGANNSLTITAQDASGNTVTSFNGTVKLTSSDASFAAGPSGNNTITIQNGVSNTSYQLNTSGRQTITAIDAANSAIVGTGNINVTPGPVASLTTNAPTATTAGASFNVTVTGQDAFGNLSTSLPAQVHFSSSDPNAVLPADTTLSASPQTFSATFRTPGSQTISVTSQTTPPITGTSSTVSVATPNLIVTTLSDGAALASACTTQATGSTGTDAACTLRDAVAFANNAGAANIAFAPVLTTSASTANPAVILLGHGELDLSRSITITGPGANLLQIDAQGQSNVVNVNSAGATVTISGLTLTGGHGTNASPLEGGGISTQGTLTLTSVAITGNTASYGGGILQTAGTLTIVGSTINGNSATQAGGAIDFTGGSLSIQGSTIANNTSTGPKAGGIGVEAGSGPFTLTASTVTGNTAASAGGGLSILGSAPTIANSIIAGNSAPGNADIQGSYTDHGGNAVPGAGISLQLTSLGFYGGPTQTVVPLPGSPALCAGTSGNLSGNPLDQRGFPRATAYGSTTCYDAGSVQSKYALAFMQQPTAILAGQAITPSPTVQIDEQGLPFSQSGINTGVVPSAGTLTGTTSQSTGGGGLATFSGLSVASGESGETLIASLALSSAITLSTTSDAFNVTTPAPTVTSLNLTSGPATGGTSVTITGTNFINASAVKFGATSASFTVNSSTQITATAPAGSVNTVDVTVTTPGGTSAVRASDQFTYVLATKTINFTPLTSPVSVGNTATLSATASNGDPVTFSVTSGTASIRTVSGVSTITYSNAGSVTIAANSAATSVYAAAAPVPYTVVVNQIAQTVTFPQPASPLTYSTGLTTTLTASASSGLAVAYKVISGPANVSGAILSYTGPGTVVVEADQAGDSTYTAATAVQRTIVVNAVPTIAFAIPNQTYGEVPFQVNATSNSSGAFTYTLTSGNATVTPGGLVTLTGVGPVTIGVAQAAAGNYTSGIGSATFNVGKGTATITLANLAQTYTGSPLPVTATTTPTGLNVSITYAGSPTAPTAAGSYAVVANIVDSNYTGSATGTLVISKATATVTLGNLSQTYTGSPLPVTATTAPTGLNVSVTYAGSPTAPTAAGSYAVVITIVDSNYAGSATGTLVISKATASVTLSNLSQTYTASPLPVTATTTPTGLNVSITYAGSPTAPTAAGSYAVVATIVDSNYTGSATGTLVISKASASVAFSGLTQTYTGSPLRVTATTVPTGLNVSTTYAGSPTAPTAAGSYSVVATIVDSNYTGSATGTLVISKASASVAFSGLTQTYTGSPLRVTATTVPTGLNVSTTYAGSPTAPTAAGSYSVVATIVDSNYSGSATSTLVISKATATVTLSNLSQTYTGSPLPVTATTTPTGLNVSVTYAGSPTTPTAAGSYAVLVTIVDSNYAGSATGTLVISKATAAVALSGLTQTYTGSPLPVTATTAPTGLNVSITYAGSPTAPTAAGSYAVVATIVDSNYTGSATGTLVISKATASVTLGNLSQTYTGSPSPVTATTTPTGLNVSITYAGSSTAPTAAGSYAVVANIVDSNYTGSATGTLVISKATASVMLSNLAQTYLGSPLPVTATTVPNGLTVGITYAGSSTAPAAADSYPIVATIVDSNYTGSATGTLVISKASATFTLGNLTQTYTGLPLPITATSNPAGLTINIAYAGSSTAPTAAGTYGITATIADSNYNGSATGALLIQKAPVTVSLVPTSVSAAYGSDERLTIAVTPAGAAAAHGATPTGTVTLIIGGAATSIALANGDATYDAGILPAGPYTVTATYNGDTDYTGLLSGSTTTPLFTITSGSLLVTANNATRPYGTSNTQFTGNVSGQQNGDTFTETFTTSAVQSSPVGTYPIVPLAAGSNLADYTVSTSNGTLSITRAGTTTTAVLNANSITTLQTLTVTANVQSTTTGTPTGSVQLLDGTSVIATTTLNGNTASFSLSGLAAGAHSFSVAYLGDTNFTGSSTAASLPVTVNVADFAFTTTNGTQTQTVIPGQTALYTFQITPETGGYPGIVTFTVSGLPPGATAVFTPNNIPVNGGPQTVTLSIKTASVSAAVERSLSPGRRAPILLGILLLPLAGIGRIRRRQLGRVLSVLLLFAGSIATLAVLTGCGSGNGYFAQTQHSYNVTVTVTSGPVVHTENVNLTLE